MGRRREEFWTTVAILANVARGTGLMAQIKMVDLACRVPAEPPPLAGLHDYLANFRNAALGWEPRAVADVWRESPRVHAWLRDRAVRDLHGNIRLMAVRELAHGWPDDPRNLALVRARATGDRDLSVRRAAVRAVADGWPDAPGTLDFLRARAVDDAEEKRGRTSAHSVVRRLWRPEICPGAEPQAGEPSRLHRPAVACPG
ncbi:HEAT repeat domain-containing protein [Actinomadura sp. B10D3]|uniref:HEAT repeat domain-containing protein n=1 Tax=Actinomadura sp. B10D3 TaxID=3153557 RepID=UPI00325CC3DC